MKHTGKHRWMERQNLVAELVKPSSVMTGGKELL